MTMTPARRRALLIAVLVFVLDQVLKLHVTRTLGLDQVGEQMELLPIFRLTYVQNIGVSLGLLTASPEYVEWARWGLVALTGAIAAGVAVWMFRERALGDLVALGLVLGGALGNITDRARLGYVIDYADLHFGNFQPFMVFNLADAAISIGVVILLVRALFLRDKQPAPVEMPHA